MYVYVKHLFMQLFKVMAKNRQGTGANMGSSAQSHNRNRNEKVGFSDTRVNVRHFALEPAISKEYSQMLNLAGACRSL